MTLKDKVYYFFHIILPIFLILSIFYLGLTHEFSEHLIVEKCLSERRCHLMKFDSEPSHPIVDWLEHESLTIKLRDTEMVKKECRLAETFARCEVKFVGCEKYLNDSAHYYFFFDGNQYLMDLFVECVP